MASSIASSARSLKSTLRHALAAKMIHAACRDSGHAWRVRTLDPVTTVWLFALQMLHANTACTHVLRLMPGIRATDSAYCQARKRLPLKVFQRLFQRVRDHVLPATDEMLSLWRGHRVFYIDGSTTSTPDTPGLQKLFGQPAGQKPGCGFPAATLVGLFRSSGLLVDLLIKPLRTHEASIAHLLFKHLKPNDLLVGDRAFSSYVLVASLQQRGAHAVMRLHQRRKTDFRRGRYLGVRDRLVRWTKPPRRPDWMDEETFDSLPTEMTLRQVEYQVEIRGYRSQKVVLVTTLFDAEQYPKKELASLYGDRWQVETYFRHLKQSMRMDVLRCKTPDGVKKELWMFGIIYNLVRSVMVEAAQRQGVKPDRISFIDTLRWLTLRRAGEPLPVLGVNPHRPGRVQPRVVKRRPKQYSLMTRPRDQMIKAMTGWKR